MIQPNLNKYDLQTKATKINVALEDVLYTRIQTSIVLYFQNSSEIFENQVWTKFHNIHGKAHDLVHRFLS